MRVWIALACAAAIGVALHFALGQFSPRMEAIPPTKLPESIDEPSRRAEFSPPIRTPAHTLNTRAEASTEAYRPPTFHGYDCTDDCSGHEAGYEWAELNDIDDPDDCGGNSDSFIEGCQAYAEEQQDSNVDEDEPRDDE